MRAFWGVMVSVWLSTVRCVRLFRERERERLCSPVSVINVAHFKHKADSHKDMSLSEIKQDFKTMLQSLRNMTLKECKNVPLKSDVAIANVGHPL